jgi:hypothetical protein
MTRKELRSNDIAWRLGIKPSRYQPPQQRARTLYQRAHEKARLALLSYGQSIGPMRGGAK